jgi:hypothetical protein
MKPKCILLFISILLANSSFSQYNENRYNINYVTTSLFDDFISSLDPLVWEKNSHGISGTKPGETPFIYVDSIATVRVDSADNKLCLTMISYPNYTTTNYDNPPKTISADYITGGIGTRTHFSYGIYECNANFAHNLGSFPAFWLMSTENCAESDKNEIDIVECKVHSTSNIKLQNHVFYWPICDESECFRCVGTGGIDWNVDHTFKCIWDPYKITFWIDNSLLHTVTNSDYIWFPRLPMVVILCQQVGTGIPITPQTSIFNWVKVREFFLAPEIFCPKVICTTTQATLDVALLASNITWSLSPAYLFSGNLSGNGKIASIVPNSNSSVQGEGKITYNFTMPTGESFSAEKVIYINRPAYEDFSYFVRKSNGTPANKVGGTWLLCPNTIYHIYVNNNGPCTTSNYIWTVPASWTQNYTYQNMISITTNSTPGGPVSVNALTCCNINSTIIQGYMGTDYNCGYYFMTFSPNPATNETVVILESESKEFTFDENAEWELEVFDRTQLLMDKITRIKGKEITIKTTGWRKGIYLVRATYKGEILFGKLSIEN